MDGSLSLPRLQTALSLAEQAYQLLQAAILSLDLKPGERLLVQRLSDRLGVSRMPVTVKNAKGFVGKGKGN